MLGVSRVAVRSLVVGLVNDTIAIEVNDIMVTNKYLTVILLTFRHTVEFIVGTDKAVVDE